MRHSVWIVLLTVAMFGQDQVYSADNSCCPPQGGFLKRLSPVGGWCPYGGGLLHWWPRHCFPCAGAPDDYCRKPLPRVCWPPYPPYYIWGPPDRCPSQVGCCPAACNPR